MKRQHFGALLVLHLLRSHICLELSEGQQRQPDKTALRLKYLSSYENITHEAPQWIAERDTMLALLRANRSLLPSYNVTADIFDSQFDAIHNIGITIRMFFDSVLDGRHNATNSYGSEPGANKLMASSSRADDDSVIPPIFFGPENSAEVRVIAQVAPFYNLACISSDAKGTDLSDRQQYPLFFRTAYTSDIMVPVVRFVLRYFNYAAVALAYVDKPIPLETLQKVDLDLHLNNYQNDPVPFQVLFRVKFTLDEPSYTRLWETINAYDARIIASYVNEADTYKIFCNAITRAKKEQKSDFGLSKYLFIFLGSATTEQLMPNAPSAEGAMLMPNCSYEELSTAIVGNLIVTFPSWAPDNTPLSFGLTSLELQQRCRSLSKPSVYGGNPTRNSDCNPTALDVYWTAFVALDAVDRRLKLQQPPRSLLNFTYQSTDIAALLSTEMRKVRFQGASGFMAYSAGGERTGDLLIAQYQRLQNSSKTYSPQDFGFRHVFRLPGLNPRRVELLSPLQFATNDGLPPPDKKATVVVAEGINGSLLTTIIVVAVGALLIFMCFVGAIVYWFHRRQLRRTLEHPPWLIDQQKIMFKTTALSVMSTASVNAQSSKSLDIASDYTTPAMFNGQAVAVQHIPLDAERLPINKQTHLMLTNFRDNLQHSNVTRFLGYALSPHHHSQYLLWEQCSKGSLEQLIENDSINLDATFQFAIMLDVAQGMAFIHKSFLHSHGSLCAASCMIDKRFTIKVSQHGEAQLAPMFGLRRFVPIDTDSRSHATTTEQADEQNISFYAERRLYWAPELLRQDLPPVEGTQQGDVYAFAITIYVLLTRSAPFESSTTSDILSNCIVTPSEALQRIRDDAGNCGKPYRPQLNCFSDKRLIAVVNSCWEEDSVSRPIFPVIIQLIQDISGLKSANITDQLFRRLEQYADDMELLVQERTRELTLEKHRSDALLNSILPHAIADELKLNGRVQPESFDSVTIYFSDIVGFTTLSSNSTPVEVVALLNALYTMFDAKIDQFDAYKVETIGDAYMVVSGLPQPNGKQHVVHIARLSLALLYGMKDFEIPHRPNEKLMLRIGLHTGPCVAGVVGIKMPRYCLFGDTVNTASRMESAGEAHQIHISEAVQQELELIGGFDIKERGKMEIKGKGAMQTYWLLGMGDYGDTSTPETAEVEETVCS